MRIVRLNQKANSLVELLLVVPLLVAVIGGSFEILSSAWLDVWRARRYTENHEPPSTSTELIQFPAWKTPVDRRSDPVSLDQYVWTKQEKRIWAEIKLNRHEN